MYRIKYVPGTKYDPFLPLLLCGIHTGNLHVNGVKDKILNEKQKDDALFLYAGKTGTGKSTLLLWSYSIYTPNQSIDFVPRSQAEFAKSLKLTKSIPIADRALMYDEAEAGKRDSMTKWNKDLIKLYSKIRGKRILHGWCYPDSDNIDTKIITNRVNGIFITYEKNTEGIRHYYYYPQESINDFLEDFGRLRLDLLIEKASKYAAYQGYFTEYDGPLRDAYFARKEEGMDQEIDKFSDKYAPKDDEEAGYFGVGDLAKHFKVGKDSVRKAIEFGLATGHFQEEQVTNALGAYKLISDDREKLGEILKQMGNRSKNRVSAVPNSISSGGTES